MFLLFSMLIHVDCTIRKRFSSYVPLKYVRGICQSQISKIAANGHFLYTAKLFLVPHRQSCSKLQVLTKEELADHSVLASTGHLPIAIHVRGVRDGIGGLDASVGNWDSLPISSKAENCRKSLVVLFFLWALHFAVRNSARVIFSVLQYTYRITNFSTSSKISLKAGCSVL